jgi:hypothetical protein
MSQILKPNRFDNRGGSRENAGAKPKGNVQYKRNIPESFIVKMDEFLKKLKTSK